MSKVEGSYAWCQLWEPTLWIMISGASSTTSITRSHDFTALIGGWPGTTSFPQVTRRLAEGRSRLTSLLGRGYPYSATRADAIAKYKSTSLFTSVPLLRLYAFGWPHPLNPTSTFTLKMNRPGEDMQSLYGSVLYRDLGCYVAGQECCTCYISVITGSQRLVSL